MIESRSVALIMFVLAGTAVRGAEPAVPDRFEFPTGGVSIWVSASAAIAADGTARPGILRPEVRRELFDRKREQAVRAEHQMESPTSRRCDVNFYALIDDADVYQAASLDALVDFAATRRVISGVVTGSAIGLHAGEPHTVLQVSTDAPAESASIVYLLYPSAELRFEGMTVCKDDPGFAPPPIVGDVVTFVAGDPIDSTATLFVTDGSWIVYEHAGTAVLPPALQSDAALRRLPTSRAVAAFLRHAREMRRESRKEGQ